MPKQIHYYKKHFLIKCIFIPSAFTFCFYIAACGRKHKCFSVSYLTTRLILFFIIYSSKLIPIQSVLTDVGKHFKM